MKVQGIICFLASTNIIRSQPILPYLYGPMFQGYPGYGMYSNGMMGGYGGSAYAMPNYGMQSPYGMTHFGTQTSYLGLGGMGNAAAAFSGWQGQPLAPLTYEVNGATNPAVLEHAGFLSLVNDKDNFVASGCGWDAVQLRCTDALGLCKGGCRDFATTTTLAAHDCRCIPYGYAALLKLVG